MADYFHPSEFNLYDKYTNKTYNSKLDFDLVIQNTNNSYFELNALPDFEDTTDKSNYYDGERFIKSKYNPRTFSLTVFASNKNNYDIDYFKSVFSKKYPLKFSYEDDWENRYIDVKLAKGFSSKVYYGNEVKFDGSFDLDFIAYDPYWHFDNERPVIFNNLKTGDSKNVKSRGNVDTSPYIYITPNTSTVKLIWYSNTNIKNNEIPITLSNLTIGREYIIDCTMEQFYYMNNGVIVNCPSQYKSNAYWDYPRIEIDKTNGFKITEGSVKSLKINPNSRMI